MAASGLLEIGLAAPIKAASALALRRQGRYRVRAALGSGLAQLAGASVTSIEHAQREITRLNQLYAALSRINRAVVRSPSREQLFHEICRALVEHGGFKLAWIGWHDPVGRVLVPVAQVGDDAGYLEGIRVYTDDRPEGRGPSGVAFRENRPYVCNDLLDDPATLPWRKAHEQHRFRASAALPIELQGQPTGTLNVYADQPGYFQEKELILLGEATLDISFALNKEVQAAERTRLAALAEREQQLTRSIVESMPGVFYLYDEGGRFLRWNSNFEEVTGYSAAEVARMHPSDFFPEQEKPLLQQRIAQVFAEGESYLEAAFLTKEGRTVPYFFTGRRIDLGDTRCLVGVGVDITERKRAEEALRKSEQRYRSTLDNILESCQLLDFDWRYLYLNDAAAEQNRRPNRELLGRRMQDAWPGIEQTHVFDLLRRCMDKRTPLHEETEFGFADGTRGWFDVRVQSVPEGIFVLSVDITERRRAELALRELNESLELKVAQRTRDLEEATRRAEAADKIKSAFLATMSHELRTPLNSILGFTGILLQGLAGRLNEEQSKQLGMVQGSARHLLALINDVLDISKIEAGQLQVRAAPFDLRSSIERTVATLRPAIEKKRLAFDVQVSSEVGVLVSDQRRVEQILLNLLSNALKFTERGRIVLRVEAVPNAGGREADGHVRILVHDTGIGMKQEDVVQLFQPFHQIDAGLERQHEGTGLGLAICRRLTGLLGGTIKVESVWGAGSTFIVELPLALYSDMPS